MGRDMPVGIYGGSGSGGSSGYIGQFASLAALQTAIPSGQPGWTAFAGGVDYDWNPVTFSWEPMGASASILTAAVGASAIGAGQPVRIDNSGKMQVAQADSYANAVGLIGLAESAASPGFPGQATPQSLTLTDWTAITGAASLVPGAVYWLSASAPGQLTTTVPTAAGTVQLRIGVAASTSTLALDIQPPFMN